MNFKERVKPETKITVMPQQIPYVLIHTVALQKMFTYTDLCADEIGWLGTAYREGNEFHITDTYLFDQEVHATTTEITPAGLEAFAIELLQQENGVEIWNNLKMWGHSHVNMGISPSGQDDKQMNEFAEVGHDWFIRLICNKKGELSVDVYDYKAGLIFKNVAWERLMSEEEEQIALQLQALQEQLDNISQVGLDERAPIIKGEMDKKVRKKVTAYSGGLNGRATAIGRYVNGVWKSWMLHAPSDQEMVTWKHLIPETIKREYMEEVEDTLKKNESVGRDAKGLPLTNKLHEEEDVYKFFDERELVVLAYSLDLFDMEEQMHEYGYEGQFSRNDLNLIRSVALSLNDESWRQYYQGSHLYY